MGTQPVPRLPWHRRPLPVAAAALAVTLVVYALGRGHLGLGLGIAVAAAGGAVWATRRRAPLAVVVGDLERAVHETRAVSAALRDSEHRYRLLADSVRDLVGELLSGLGYRVLTAANGAEAVAVCQRHPGRIDLMLSDVIMPGMSGPDAAARLRTLRPEMKVLYVSGYADNAIARHGRFEPGVSLLLKPFDPAELARAVRRRLDGVTTAR
jgi:CheY-like chemotaxis protein